MKNQKISFIKGCIYIPFAALIMAVILIVSAIYIERNTDDAEENERRLHKANFLENVEFQGDILRIKQLGWRYRHSVTVCLKLNKIEVDSSKIIDGNIFFNLDWVVTNLGFSHVGDDPTRDRLLKMNKVHHNKNGNGKLMFYSSHGDSLDATPHNSYFYVVNSENTQFCRDFVE